MAENVELFDLGRADFEQTVLGWALPAESADPKGASWFQLRKGLKILAGLIWTLGQRVKKLEREE